MELSVLDRQNAVLMQRLGQNSDMIVDHCGGNVHRYPLFDYDHRRQPSKCNNSPTAAAATTTVSETSSRHCRENNSVSTKKRKAEYDVVKEEEEAAADESQSQSAITAKNNDEKANSDSTEKSKVSQQKPDYIHVRARRGQATDSHSLAERARREKISKKMKWLQDLVPGCNSRATGKAGMLDEIINHVQSLQKQVEFLSMKLSVLNTRLDFSNDDFLAKEMPAYIASLPPEAQYDSIDATSFLHHGFDIAMNQTLKASTSSLAASTQIPEVFFDPSFVHQLQQMSCLESEFPNPYNMGLQ